MRWGRLENSRVDPLGFPEPPLPMAGDCLLQGSRIRHNGLRCELGHWQLCHDGEMGSVEPWDWRAFALADLSDGCHPILGALQARSFGPVVAQRSHARFGHCMDSCREREMGFVDNLASRIALDVRWSWPLGRCKTHFRSAPGAPLLCYQHTYNPLLTLSNLAILVAERSVRLCSGPRLKSCHLCNTFPKTYPTSCDSDCSSLPA